MLQKVYLEIGGEMERDILIEEAEKNFSKYIREATSGNEFTRMFAGFTKMALETHLTRLFESSIKKWIAETLDKIMKAKIEQYIQEFFEKGKADKKVSTYIEKQFNSSYWFMGTNTVKEFCDKEAKKYLDKFGDKMQDYLDTKEGMTEMLKEISDAVMRLYCGL